MTENNFFFAINLITSFLFGWSFSSYRTKKILNENTEIMDKSYDLILKLINEKENLLKKLEEFEARYKNE